MPSKRKRRAKRRKLLLDLARLLTACDEAGMRVAMKHGAVLTRDGYVLPTDDEGWVARTLTYTKFSPDD